ncbi:hypothetical protein DFH07DRAFT_763724 [Mycena maculata]|uniref:Uncharacterized protein n=1 Tax=Mycena maculata TaxID=230809 RepID=A0AAD7KGH2_9AGAR|nr:hypothetical protein DFH07DRAFT_763724 [Mycena maculata]
MNAGFQEGVLSIKKLGVGYRTMEWVSDGLGEGMKMVGRRGRMPPNCVLNLQHEQVPYHTARLGGRGPAIARSAFQRRRKQKRRRENAEKPATSSKNQERAYYEPGDRNPRLLAGCVTVDTPPCPQGCLKRSMGREHKMRLAFVMEIYREQTMEGTSSLSSKCFESQNIVGSRHMPKTHSPSRLNGGGADGTGQKWLSLGP